MSEKSISHCQGKGCLSHNNRDFKPKNVDSSRTIDNITFVNQPIDEAYEECFGEAVERYNIQQKRNDRKIKDGYFQSVFNRSPCNTVVTSPDKRKSFYEDLVQIGTKDDTGIGTADSKLAKQCLIEYVQGFQQRNPNFHVFNAVLHMDEATPHLHIDYIPIGHYNRGIDTQNGIAQALKEMGYGNGKDAINRWRVAERAVLEDICNQWEIKIAEPQKSRGYSFSVEEYKKIKDMEKEIAELQTYLEEKREQVFMFNQARGDLGLRGLYEKMDFDTPFFKTVPKEIYTKFSKELTALGIAHVSRQKDYEVTIAFEKQNLKIIEELIQGIIDSHEESAQNRR